MSDVGRSTSAHEPRAGPRREREYPEAHEALTAWGAWQRDCRSDEPDVRLISVTARMAQSGYRESPDLPTAYDEDEALATDRMLAMTLRPGEIDVISCGYVSCLPSREAADWISGKYDNRITHTAYRSLLDEAVGRFAMALELRDLIRMGPPDLTDSRECA